MTTAKSRRRTTQWNLFFHYAAIALAMISGIVFVPLYLRFIPVALYGAWLATGNIVAWLTVVDPGLSTVLQQRAAVAYGDDDIEELNALLTGGVLISGAISIAVLVVGVSSSRFVIGWLQLPGDFDTALLHRCFLLAVAGTALMIFSYGITAFNQGLQSSVAIGVVFVISTVASLLVTAVLLFNGIGLLAIPIGLVLRGCGLTVGNAGYLVWRYAREQMPYRFSLARIATLARLSSYTFLGRGTGVLATNLDAFVLTRFLGADVAPVFVLTRKAADISRTFAERPAVAFMPAISHLVGAGGQEQARLILVRLVRLILWLLGLLGAGFIVFNADFVSLWVGPDFFAGQTINVIIAASLIVTVLVNMLSNLCFSLGNIKGNSVATFAQGIVSVPLVIIGAKFWGLLGVALAPLLATLAVAGWYFPYTFTRLVELRRTDLRAFAVEIACVLAAAALAGLALAWTAATSWPMFILEVIAFSVVYGTVLLIISRAARGETARLLNRWPVLAGQVPANQTSNRSTG